MKKLLILLLALTLGLTSKAQTQTQNDTMHLFFYNPYQYGCFVSVIIWYRTSSLTHDTIINSMPSGSPNIIFPNQSYQNGTLFNEALVVFPHDTTLLIKTMQIGYPWTCYGFQNHYCTTLAEYNVKFCNTPVLFFQLCGDTIPTGVSELKSPIKNVVRIIDEMGRDAKPVPNKTFIYLYNDGTIERKVILKD